MESNDLMNDDYVYIVYETVKKPAKVIRLEQHYITVITQNGTEIKAAYSCVEPIPLGIKFLADNGFRYEGSSMVLFPQGREIENQCYVECFMRRNGEVRNYEILNYDKSFKDTRNEHISVHEFQHALSACKLKNIAINFKMNET